MFPCSISIVCVLNIPTYILKTLFRLVDNDTNALAPCQRTWNLKSNFVQPARLFKYKLRAFIMIAWQRIIDIYKAMQN